MKKFLITITLLLFLTCFAAHAQWRSDTHDVYNALQKTLDIEIDGQLNDNEGWQDVLDTVKGTNGEPFCEVEFAGDDGKIYVFREFDGGEWNDRDDHRTCFGIVWDPDAIYLALSVTDDEHQNGGGAWDGDSLQMAFEPTGKRGAGLTLFLYNIALDNNAENLILHNERPNGTPGLVSGENFAITRNEGVKETYYEIKITPEVLGLKAPFKEGYELGVALCVNDGDKDTPGQKGWSGWYTDCIVNGPKSSENTGLVVLTDETLAVEAKNKLTTTWGRLKSVR